ncbi:MAG: TonB-dependent receptor [Reichenbachiella sp.]|uniref:TonB-dependent receptor n=1 Tax=Reichenbachiella sp. TaxID=2184521 RepID=UPI002966186A|nr:TonB-dependent receptor [Reichenbachiella sp.]MDW3208763.1 TonB-dependent receptor [Reichenbachiella sp.]
MNKYYYLALLCLFSTGSVLAQEKTDLKINTYFHELPLEKVLTYLEEQSDYTFSYSSSAIPLDEKVTLKEQDISFWYALDESLKYLPVSYEVVNQNIVLKYNELTQTIRGTILDKDTKQPIFGATVMVVGSDPLIGATTDMNGNYRLTNVPVGRLTLHYGYLGYEEGAIPNVLLGSGKELILDVELVESVIKMEEIVVSATGIGSQPLNEMGMISGRSFTVEETKRYPISIGDPMRLASSFAGVMGTDDDSNEIVIRGNSPRGILWKMEGVEIPNPNHFSSEGASSGGISMFSTQVISRSDFYTGAFAPIYGNVLSGVFDINLRKGNNEKHEHTVQAGLLGIDLSSEGPISKSSGSSYLFNYRYSTLSILSDLGVVEIDENEKNTFQDLAFKVNFPTENMGTFSVFGMGGLSKYSRTGEGFREDIEKYNMGVIGVSNDLILNSSTFLKTNVSVSGTEVGNDEFVKYQQDTINVDYNNLESFKKSYTRGSVILNKKFNSRHILELGTVISWLDYDFVEREHNINNADPFVDLVLFNDEGASGTQQAFVSWKFRITEKLSLVNGLHYFRFSFTGEDSWEPRSSLKWQFRENQSITAGFGMHSRLESLEYYLGNHINSDGTTVDNNPNLGMSKANHFVLGYDRVLGPSLYFKTEVYYQHLYNIPISNNPAFGWYSSINSSDDYSTIPLVNEGTGENYGIEMTLDKRFSRNYYFMVNGSIFESKYKGGDEIERNSRFNGNFTYHGLGGKEWKVGKNGKNNILGVSAKISYAGNKRLIPIDLEESIDQGRQVNDFDRAFEERAPDYFRFDLQISYRKNRAKSTSEWRLDLQNVTGRMNYGEQYYNDGLQQIVQEDQIGLIPVLSYRIEF